MGFFAISVYNVFTWFCISFTLFRYLTWNCDKMAFWVSLYFHEQVNKGVKEVLYANYRF
jgi:hypothetical protein